MGWSTRQVAELAGTTVKAVRHYHEVGLLAEPERDTNNYKQYRVAHLVRLLRIRRLSDLGVPLSEIAAMGEADEHPEKALEVLDTELAATIDRLQGIRAELAVMRQSHLPTDLPSGLAAVADGLSEADRGLMVVYGRVLGPDGIEALQQLITTFGHSPIDTELADLPADADEASRADLAGRLHHHVRALQEAHPDAFTAQLVALGGTAQLARTIGLALTDLYNDAQLDVMVRLSRMFAGSAGQPDAHPGHSGRALGSTRS